MWNYLTVPFLLVGSGFATRELDDHAEAHFAVLVFDPAEDPHARPVHLYDRVDPLRRREKQCLNRLRRRHGIAVEGNNRETMAGQCKRDVLARARIE